MHDLISHNHYCPRAVFVRYIYNFLKIEQ